MNCVLSETIKYRHSSSRRNDELLVYRYYITIVFSWRKKSESLGGGKRQGFDSTYVVFGFLLFFSKSHTSNIFCVEFCSPGQVFFSLFQYCKPDIRKKKQ